MTVRLKSLIRVHSDFEITYLQELRHKSRLEFGDQKAITFLNDISKILMAPNVRRDNPEFASLGFFLRRSNIESLLAKFTHTASQVNVPRGLVFHVPPANVDTVFMYSWALSVLAGNSNVVRISNRAGDATRRLLELISDVLEKADSVFKETQLFIEYERNDDISEAISETCDLRVVWGGDETVRQFRKFPLSALSREISFPNRTSMSVVNLEIWSSSSSEVLSKVGDDFVRDIYWFDQAACSSPRVIFAIGPTSLLNEFIGSLGRVVIDALQKRGISQDASVLMEKTVRSQVALATGKASSVDEFRNRNFVSLVSTNGELREWCGVGAVNILHVNELSDVSKHVVRTDQTMTYFGFSEEQLSEFILRIGQLGVDRVVPIGSALDFSYIWDGMNLVSEFSRIVTIQ